MSESPSVPQAIDSSRVWRGAALAAFVLLAATLLYGLGSFGVWDPWELDVSDAARSLGRNAATRPAGPLTLIAWSFQAFGEHEWAGRLPGVLCGLATLGLVWFHAASTFSLRTALFSTIVAGTSLLLILSSRQMLGSMPETMASAAVYVAAASLAFGSLETMQERILKIVFLAAAVGLALWMAGGLLGVAPPLVSVAAMAALHWKSDNKGASQARLALVGLTLLSLGFVVSAVFRDAAGYSAWLGGTPGGMNPPSFDRAIELLFHSFAPWSAFLLPAAGRMLTTENRDEAPQRLSLALSVALSYGVTVLFSARYGTGTFLGLLPAAVLIGVYLDDLDRSKKSWMPDAVVVALLTGLLIRDFALYPESPLRGLSLSGLTFPSTYNAKKYWAVTLGLFTVASALALAVAPSDERNPTSSIRTVRMWMWSQWRLSAGHRAWMSVIGLLLTGCLSVGASAFIVPQESLGLNSLVVRILQALTFLPTVLSLLAVFVIELPRRVARLGRFRLAPVMIAALGFAVYSAQIFQPGLSAHFSPAEVYETYNALRSPQDTLVEFHVSGRAAAYYAEGEAREVSSDEELLQAFAANGRNWALIPADELAELNRKFRSRSGKHLFVADARSARVVLVTDEDIAGRRNENFAKDAVYTVADAPTPAHPVGARFDERIELVGYDLELPQDGFVGPGQQFTVTWHWKVIASVPGGHKIFLHIDGFGLRLNGDHEAVQDRYPVRYWEPGDVILDRQTLTVPTNYRSGDYSMMIGFYSGNDRLAVTPESLDDGADRANVGRLTVR